MTDDDDDDESMIVYTSLPSLPELPNTNHRHRATTLGNEGEQVLKGQGDTGFVGEGVHKEGPSHLREGGIQCHVDGAAGVVHQGQRGDVPLGNSQSLPKGFAVSEAHAARSVAQCLAHVLQVHLEQRRVSLHKQLLAAFKQRHAITRQSKDMAKVGLPWRCGAPQGATNDYHPWSFPFWPANDQVKEHERGHERKVDQKKADASTKQRGSYVQTPM